MLIQHAFDALSLRFEARRPDRDFPLSSDDCLTRFYKTGAISWTSRCVDFNADNQVVGVEILNLSKRSPNLNLRELQFQTDKS